MLIYISLANSEISPQERKIYPHELWILYDFIRSSSHTAKLGEDLPIRQVMNRMVSVLKSGRSMSGHYHVDGTDGIP